MWKTRKEKESGSHKKKPKSQKMEWGKPTEEPEKKMSGWHKPGDDRPSDKIGEMAMAMAISIIPPAVALGAMHEESPREAIALYEQLKKAVMTAPVKSQATKEILDKIFDRFFGSGIPELMDNIEAGPLRLQQIEREVMRGA